MLGWVVRLGGFQRRENLGGYMKRKLQSWLFSSLLLLALVLTPFPGNDGLLHAQVTGNHTVTLSWTASPDGGVYTMYRATGVCSPTLTFTAISVGITSTVYVDSGIAPGKFCYQVTTVVNSAESNASNQAQAVIIPLPPGNLTDTTK